MEACYPVEYEVPHRGLTWLQWYGKHSVYHPGHDLNFGKGDDDLGSSILCPLRAEVEYVSPMGKNGGLGHYVVLYHPGYGLWTRYLHLGSSKVKKGDILQAGEKFATMGKTGTTWSHLHWDGFRENLYYKMKDHWSRPFGFYPSGKNKAWIQEHFVDLLKLISDIKIKEKEETALQWCKKHLPEANWVGTSENEATKFRALALRIKSWFI